MIAVNVDEASINKIMDAVGRIDTIKDLPFIASTALNDTAFGALRKLQREIPSYIDRPTPFAINSLYVSKATKSRPEASIQWRAFGQRRPSVGRALYFQTFGGERKAKGFESALQVRLGLPWSTRVVPTKNAPIDGYGNVPGKVYTQVLSYLRANQSGIGDKPSGPLNARQRRARAKAAFKVFAVYGGRIKGTGQPTRLPDGIWERQSFGALGSGFRQLFFFTTSVKYRSRFPADQIVDSYVVDAFPRHLEEAIDKAIKARANFSG